jgi:hypothetical protein
MRPHQDTLTFGRESDEAPSTLHDHDAEFFLQAANPGRQRWLRNMASFRCLAEMFFARKRDQIIELSDKHASILPQIAGILPKYSRTTRLAGLRIIRAENPNELAP